MPMWYETIIFSLLISMNSCTILITAWYQHIDRSYYGLQLINLVLAVLVALIFWIFVPESPKWLFFKGFYQQSRKNLKYIGKLNGLPESQLRQITNSRFEGEYTDKKLMTPTDSEASTDTVDSVAAATKKYER